MENKLQCPNCQIDMDDFSSGKDLTISNGEVDIYTGRLSMKCCPECRYCEESTIEFS